MKPVLFKLGGTSGSGKSTVARGLLHDYPSTRLEQPNGKLSDYLLQLAPRRQLVLLGNYDTPCGGCDGIQPYDEIVRRLHHYAGAGYSVLMEGLMIGVYGRLGAAMDAHQRTHEVWHAWMDTPLDLCLDRVQQRRSARGNLKPLDPTNTTRKWQALRTLSANMAAKGHRTVHVDHRRPVKHVLSYFGVQLTREPRNSR